MTKTVSKETMNRLATACEVMARQWRGGNPPGHDAVIELHRAFKKATPELLRPELDHASDYARLEQERDRLRGALEKAQVGLMCCAPLPGYDMKTLHIVRAALAPAQEPEA